MSDAAAAETPISSVSVLIPSIGRPGLLERCLRSVLACDPLPAEVVVVDQSTDGGMLSLVEGIDSPLVRHVACDGVGIAKAMNDGLAAVAHDTVLVTHDDCTVAANWVGVGLRHIRDHPGGITTGRVLPPDGSAYVPSTKTDPEPHDYTGTLTSGALYPANMVVDRRRVQDLGGFDERASLLVAAEDNDLCYRWLSAGRSLRYEPDMVVWHHDWRTPEQLVGTHIAYARAQGGFYAKHLRSGDLRLLHTLSWDLRAGARSVVLGVVRRRPRWQDPYREMVGSLLAGMVCGWRAARADERRTGSRVRRRWIMPSLPRRRVASAAAWLRRCVRRAWGRMRGQDHGGGG